MARLLYHHLTLLIDVQLQLLAGELVEDIDADDVRDLLESHQDGDRILDRRLTGGSYDFVVNSLKRSSR